MEAFLRHAFRYSAYVVTLSAWARPSWILAVIVSTYCGCGGGGGKKFFFCHNNQNIFF